ncbi:MAG: MerR family transcriptional regulator [Solirubrobacterales bacterium]
MGSGRSFTLSELARELDTPQHRLIYFCEKGVIAPELQDAHGRGSSRVFSVRNLLEFSIALHLRAAMLPLAAVDAVLRVLRTFEEALSQELPGFSLPESLRQQDAPELRVIVSDGSEIFFSLATVGGETKLFGGIPLDQVTGDRPGPVKLASLKRRDEAGPTNGGNGTGVGGIEGSRFVRLEISITAIGLELPLG